MQCMHIFGDDLGSRDFDISNMLGDEAISKQVNYQGSYFLGCPRHSNPIV